MSLVSGYVATLTIERPGGRIGPLVAEKWSGGNIDTDSTKHRNAITRKHTARGGLKTRENVTLSFEADAAMWALRKELEDAAGIDPVVGVRQMVGPRGERIGVPEHVTGKIKTPKYPDYELDGNEVGLVEIEIDADE